jgi:vacuolar protein 8
MVGAQSGSTSNIPEKYQVDIVKADGLKPLLRLLHSSYLPLVLSAAACVRNVSIHPANESPIIEAGFLQPLIGLLSFDENEEVQCHAISTLRNLAASSESNKGAIVEAGAVDRIQELVLQVPLAVQSEMTACVAVLALSGELFSSIAADGSQTTSSRSFWRWASARFLSRSPARQVWKCRATVLPLSATCLARVSFGR